MAPGDVVVSSEQEAAHPASRIKNGFTWLRRDAVHHGLDQRAECEVLADAALGVLCVALQQTLVSVALDVDTEDGSGVDVDQVGDHAARA